MHDRDTNAAINIKKFAISAYQITAGTAGRACGVVGNSQDEETGSHDALASGSSQKELTYYTVFLNFSAQPRYICKNAVNYDCNNQSSHSFCYLFVTEFLGTAQSYPYNESATKQ
jgi:hypothetical protein